MLSDVTEVTTTLGVVVVAAQLQFNRRQARTALEDDLSREYRRIASCLPPEAFYDPAKHRRESIPDFREELGVYMQYIDLSNQQVFLRSQRRISRGTWELWRDGIEDNLRHRAAFEEAWRHVRKHSSKSFTELKRVECECWSTDPAYWFPPRWLRPVARWRLRLPRRCDKH